MAYCIFLKSLRILEEFRKNPCVKIPPKSPCANFQSIGKFKNPIFILKGFFSFRPNRPSSQLAHSAFWPTWPCWPPSSSFTCTDRAPPPPHTPPCQGRHATLLLGHGVDPTGQARHYPPLLSRIPPLLHSGNGSIKDTIYHRHPAYPGHLRLPPGPIKG
jgi:hypothetical protein